MTISRRGFFRTLLASTAASAVLDPEQLLWVPGQKAFFDLGTVPDTVGEFGADPYYHWRMREGLRALEAQLAMVNLVNREYSRSGSKRGDTIRIRLPHRYGGESCSVRC